MRTDNDDVFNVPAFRIPKIFEMEEKISFKRNENNRNDCYKTEDNA